MEGGSTIKMKYIITIKNEKNYGPGGPGPQPGSVRVSVPVSYYKSYLLFEYQKGPTLGYVDLDVWAFIPNDLLSIT